MPNCAAIEPLVTPYVDGQLGDADRQMVDLHLRHCPPCHSRVSAERDVRDLMRERRSGLTASRAPDRLRRACASLAERAPQTEPARAAAPVPVAVMRTWRNRLAPLAAAASLLLIVGAAFLYQLTASSTRVLAAELAADHVKCFAMNGVFHTHDDAAAVERSMLSGFDWPMQLPEEASQAGLELVGSRPCLYGQGKIAHIMYRHNGEPVSLFMLPKTERTEELVRVLGYKAAIWCAHDRTFVLMARESTDGIERMAAVVRASLR